MLRNLAIRLVLWLCARYQINLLDETRQPHGSDAKNRAIRWEAFAREEGGLYDMIAKRRQALFEAYADTLPSEREAKDNLAMQDRCWRQLKVEVQSVIATGQVEAFTSPTIAPFRKSAERN